jgi:hypothetical protein
VCTRLFCPVCQATPWFKNIICWLSMSSCPYVFNPTNFFLPFLVLTGVRGQRPLPPPPV